MVDVIVILQKELNVIQEKIVELQQTKDESGLLEASGLMSIFITEDLIALNSKANKIKIACKILSEQKFEMLLPMETKAQKVSCFKCGKKYTAGFAFTCTKCGWHNPDFSSDAWGAGQKQ